MRPTSLPQLLHAALAPTQDSDRGLLERFAASGDEAAFAVIVERHGPMLLGLCRRQLGDVHLAEDVLQATFLVLARKAGSIRRGESLAGWLCGVARRLARHARRGQAARARRELLAAERVSATPTGDPAWDELLGVLDDELQRLSERYRAPLLLCYLQGRTQDEAAHQLGWSLSTLRRRLDRGRELLRLRLNRRGATLGAALFAGVLAPSTARAALGPALRQALLAVARPGATGAGVSPTILTLAHRGMRMQLSTKLSLCLALAVSAVLTGFLWQTAPATQHLASPPPAVVPPAADTGGPAKPPAPGRDLFDDPLPKGAVARLGTVRFRHGAWGGGLTFTPDGKGLVSSGGGWIRRWDLATGEARVSVGNGWPNGYVQTYDLVTADGKLGYFIHYDSMQRPLMDWKVSEHDLDNGKLRRNFSLDLPGPISRIGVPRWLSPDGKRCAGVAGEGFLVWNLTDGSLALHLKAAEGKYQTLAFAPDNKTVLVGDDSHTIHVFDLATGKELRSFGVANVKGVTNMALSPDGKRLVTVTHGDGFLRLWDVARGTEERTLEFSEEGSVWTLLFTPDGGTVMAGIEPNKGNRNRSGVLRAWDAATGKPARSWTDDPAVGWNAAVDKTGKVLATINYDGVIRLWDRATGQEMQPRPASPAGLEAVTFLADGKTMMTLGTDRALRGWSAATGQLLGPARAMLKSDGRFAAAGFLIEPVEGKDAVRLLDAATGKLLLEVPGQAAVVSPDGKGLATSDKVGHIRVFDVGSDKPLRDWVAARETDDAEAPVPTVRGFSADGQSLVVQGEIVVVWNLVTGKPKTSWSLLRSNVVVKLEKSGKVEKPGKGGFGKKASTVSYRGIRAVAVSRDGSRIAFGLLRERQPGPEGGRSIPFARIMVLETATAKLLHQADVDEEISVNSLAFSPDGKLVATGGWQKVRAWEVGDDKAAWTFDGHRGPVRAVAFSPDGKRLASASQDSTVLVWDLK
jgi:RNA polymerase sigma factor (sigma-70 family)